MKNIKNQILEYIDNQYQFESDKNLDILKSLSIKKILSSEKYNHIYDNIYLIQNSDNSFYPKINHDKSNYNISINQNNTDDSPLFAYVNDGDMEILNDFYDIAINSIDENDYNHKLLEFFNNNEKIYCVKNYFNLLSSDTKSHEEFISPFLKNNLNFSYSDLYQNNILKHDTVFKQINNLRFNFNDLKNSLLLKTIEIKSINELNLLYGKDIFQIEQEIKNNNPTLNIKKENQKIQFHLFSSDEKSLEINKINNLIKHKDFDHKEIIKNYFNSPYDLNDIDDKKFFGHEMLRPCFTKSKSSEYFVLIATNENNELMGALSMSSMTNSNIKDIGFVFTKKQFRKSGLSYKMYSKMAEICIENNFMLFNNNYTLEGRVALPSVKNKIHENFHDFILIDTDFKDPSLSHFQCQLISKFNNNVRVFMENEENNKTFDFKLQNMIEFKKIYDQSYRELRKNKYDDPLLIGDYISLELHSFTNEFNKLKSNLKSNKPSFK